MDRRREERNESEVGTEAVAGPARWGPFLDRVDGQVRGEGFSFFSVRAVDRTYGDGGARTITINCNLILPPFLNTCRCFRANLPPFLNTCRYSKRLMLTFV
ncbi:hypothetical protein BRADI_3g09734v3 [Brachypodium distachyon]|uniref:Uncharacterized protein n=1 Tax=Brachypodium distachyon TaxID=15368 RepID=A0A0Q3PXW7_BRADI|nr:hypothetical protein BRADI_3g09734v3 [Brachypodium distachyon]